MRRKRAQSATAPPPASIAARVVTTAAASGRSATASSVDSISAEALAASSSMPLPWLTERVAAFGRIAIQTGIPMRSSPVTSASRVMPIWARWGASRATVSAGGQARSE
jgi:hypothetical protein